MWYFIIRIIIFAGLQAGTPWARPLIITLEWSHAGWFYSGFNKIFHFLPFFIRFLEGFFAVSSLYPLRRDTRSVLAYPLWDLFSCPSVFSLFNRVYRCSPWKNLQNVSNRAISCHPTKRGNHAQPWYWAQTGLNFGTWKVLTNPEIKRLRDLAFTVHGSRITDHGSSSDTFRWDDYIKILENFLLIRGRSF